MSTKPPSPLLGYNNNVRHKGKVFHIQTEDSGVRYGHVITHLFMDGGRILKSVKTSYAEYRGNDRIADIVREMMKQQHKAIFIALRDGKFDAVALEASAPGTMPTPPAPSPSVTACSGDRTPPFAEVPTREAASVSGARFEAAADAPIRPLVEAEDPSEPTPARRSPEDLALDLDALDRAATTLAPPVLRTTSDLPPPPASLLRERTASGRHRVAPSPTAALPGGDTPPASLAVSRQQLAAERPVSQTPAVATGEPRRYAPTRPASIFGQARPQKGKSIFGEDLVRDESLDEVILSYLADDADGEAEGGKK